MKLRYLTHLALLISVAASGCSDGGPPGPLVVDCTGRADTTKVPLNDLVAGCYLQYQGGLYPGGTNALSGAHLTAGVAAAAQIAPLDVNGQPSPSGRYVLVSVGMSNTTQEFCSDGGLPASCQSTSFMAQAAADAAVNHTTLTIVNGALGGRAAPSWVSDTSAEYNRIRDTWLTPLGLSEKQVQIAWVKVANPGPLASLPRPNSDAFVLESQIGQIARALKTRYPNLRQMFLTSRIYAGFATTTLNPEPYAYQSAFSVKWAIESQMSQMSGGAGDARTGDLRYNASVAPWMAWGPYPWAAGTKPRSDGVTWLASDFAADGTHPATVARQKVGAMLLSFFKTSPATNCWFLAGQVCR